MRSRLSAVTIAATAALLAAPAASQDTNARTETQERLAQGASDFPWDLLGLFGILGLLGLRRDHPDDGYHPASVE